MKTIILRTLAIAALFLTANGIIAQPPPPPDQHGGSGNAPAGGGGSLTGGLGILLALGAAYGGRKVYKAFQQDDKQVE